MSAAILKLPGVRAGIDQDPGRLLTFQDAIRIGLLPYGSEGAARQAIRRRLIPGVVRQPRWLGGYELLLDPWVIDPWLRQRGRVTISDWRRATRAQLWAWERAGRLKFSRKVSRSKSSISQPAKN